ncbi:MAG: hypothetical protein MZV63_72130 [Marinilabiliales bacterium]|nr:hypothetical protein [Marinilabiliales bacterium]
MTTNEVQPKILILATLSGGYRGADLYGAIAPGISIQHVHPAGDEHGDISTESFYLKAFERGFDGIIVMYSGTDSPYKGESERTAVIINSTYEHDEETGN